jgi:adenine/guanine phosphoribosyltransferase-like PRPP-binding protein
LPLHCFLFVILILSEVEGVFLYFAFAFVVASEVGMGFSPCIKPKERTGASAPEVCLLHHGTTAKTTVTASDSMERTSK